MHTQDAPKSELIEGVLALVRQKVGSEQVAAAVDFVARYFSQVDPEDLAERSIADLYGAALSHWHFMQRHVSGTARLRVYNPTLEEHGWQSTHTVIEIVNDDMPFLVDSITMEVNRQGLTLHLIVHPVMSVRRDAAGRLTDLLAPSAAGDGRYESVVHAEVDRRTDAACLTALHEGLLRTLGDVRSAVDDWRRMQHRLVGVAAEVEQNPPPQDAAQTVEDRAFLQWIVEGNFTLLGYRCYDLVVEGGKDALRIVPGSGLGILRETPADAGKDSLSASFAVLPPELRAQARARRLLILIKSNTRSTVHRPGYLDYIGIRRFDSEGQVVGEHRFLGLYTSTAYNANPAEIPLLRRKIAHVVHRAGFLPKSHAAKALTTILEQYPRDELFQIDEDELLTAAMGILRLGERQRTRLFVRRDPFGRFVSCLIYVPRDRYNTELRHRIDQLLMASLNGVSSESSVQLSESVLARILIVVRTKPGATPEIDVRELESRIVRASRRWEDDLRQSLVEHAGEERGLRLFARYGAAFPAGYREDYAARNAVADIELMEALAGDDTLSMSLYRPIEAPSEMLRLKIFRAGAPVALSESLPMLEHMGTRVLEERPYKIERQGVAPAWMHDIAMSTGAEEVNIERVRALFQDTFLRVWRREAENDDFNRLVPGAGLTWREVALLRGYAKYARQAGFTFSQAYMEATLAAHPAIARQLVELFHLRFDPNAPARREDAMGDKAAAIEAALDRVANLDDDRILRHFLALIGATLRTNYFQRNGAAALKDYVSFKLDSRRVPGLPEPKPLFEIFVYSPRFEGVHLRGGKVARGGLRWSDRMEDFRTEVLGLVKAQMVKNAVIVPVGSKGGFVLKRPPAGGDRDALTKEAVACYRSYLHGLLDLTDNRVLGAVVPPVDVVRHDADDPYLVVAADKGTASFSDYANAVAREHGFWLDDAFASGGSAGYDHKKMGITARGAWESVKRHFRELGLNTQTQDFTCVGVGDMSGDVFGNGMLLSPHIKLVAAFDHRHIFIDPDPDPQRAFAERQRLFDLPRSSWADYGADLISPGGGVFPRGAKSIGLSAAARQVLGVDAAKLTPAELMRAILLAPVDLLYNGGIGTYVKAGSESNAQVGDRANDAIRVNGSELRCRVVAEGGNLGCTQLGRIEYALKGGRINTDAIDNSAGVDTSDHEVNIKILLNSVVAEGELTEKQRNALLVEMTDEVARLVLADNYYQTQVLSVGRTLGPALLDEQARYIRTLEKAGRLNRAIEFLPGDDELAERRSAGGGLTAPELAVLLAYSKMELFDAILASDAPEDPVIARSLAAYFPTQVRTRYAAAIARHPLRREIIATCVTNEMVNRMGSTLTFRIQEETGAGVADILRGYTLTREVFRLPALWLEIEALDARAGAAAQAAMFIATGRLILRGTQWMLRRRFYFRDLEKSIQDLGASAAAVSGRLESLLVEADAAALAKAAERFAEQGVPQDLARRVALLDPLFSALDIAEVARSFEHGVERSVEQVAAVYFALGGRLDFQWLADQIAALRAQGHWQGLARGALRDDLSNLASTLTAEVFRRNPDIVGEGALIDVWESHRAAPLQRYRQVLTDLKAAGTLDMPMLSVALRELRALV